MVVTLGLSLLESDDALCCQPKCVPQVSVRHVLQSHDAAEDGSAMQVTKVWAEE